MAERYKKETMKTKANDALNLAFEDACMRTDTLSAMINLGKSSSTYMRQQEEEIRKAGKIIPEKRKEAYEKGLEKIDANLRKTEGMLRQATALRRDLYELTNLMVTKHTEVTGTIDVNTYDKKRLTRIGEVAGKVAEHLESMGQKNAAENYRQASNAAFIFGGKMPDEKRTEKRARAEA
ncbi:MAG: hypothetical protein QXD77_03330 [Candidatus Aenigmatarchaeota archaeon]